MLRTVQSCLGSRLCGITCVTQKLSENSTNFEKVVSSDAWPATMAIQVKLRFVFNKTGLYDVIFYNIEV